MRADVGRAERGGAPQAGGRSPARRLHRAVAGGLLAGAALAGTVLVVPATPARAVQDPERPHATVTRGPSCVPGGLVLQVQAGTTAVHVVLATTRSPEGEDARDLPAGGTALLHTGDVAWGETVDGRLLSTPADGSGRTWVDELDDWTLTRPTEADCLIAGTAGAPTPAPAGGAPAAPSAVVSEGAAGADGESSRAVGAGRPITVTGRGFAPGEPVSVQVDGAPGVLARGTAGSDGTVTLRVVVPPRARGTTGLDLTGGDSGTAARVELQVAALRLPLAVRPATGGSPLLPPLLALACLTATGAALVPVARRSAALRRGPAPPGRSAVPGGGGASGGARWAGAPVGARDGARPPR